MASNRTSLRDIRHPRPLVAFSEIRDTEKCGYRDRNLHFARIEDGDMSDDDTLISELMNKIPGFGGYREASKLRDDDRAARKFLAQRLGECAGSLDRLAAEAIKRLQLDMVAEVEAIRGEVDRAKQRVVSAIEGYSSFWQSSGADADAIRQAMEIDHALVSTADQIDSQAQSCTKSTGEWDAGQFRTWTDHLHRRLDRRSELLDGGN